MNKHKLFLLSAVLLCTTLTTGCWLWPFGDDEADHGFKARGDVKVEVVGQGLIFFKNTNVRGDWQSDNGSATGEIKTFSSCCGTVDIPEGRVPARWQIFAGVPGVCLGQLTNPNVDVIPGQTIVAECLSFGPPIFPFITAPGSVDLQAPPSTMEMSGSGLNTTYGMPRIEYTDQYTGNLIATTTATTVSSDGTWLQAVTPNLLFVYSGTFNMFVSNAKADGSFEYVGTATVDAYGRDYPFHEPPLPGECGCPPDGPCIVCGPIS